MRAVAEITRGADGFEAGFGRLQKLRPEHMEQQLLSGVEAGLKELQAMYTNSIQHLKTVFGKSARG